MAYLLNAGADVSSRAAKGVFFGLSLHRHPYFIYTSSDGFEEPVHNA